MPGGSPGPWSVTMKTSSEPSIFTARVTPCPSSCRSALRTRLPSTCCTSDPSSMTCSGSSAGSCSCRGTPWCRACTSCVRTRSASILRNGTAVGRGWGAWWRKREKLSTFSSVALRAPADSPSRSSRDSASARLASRSSSAAPRTLCNGPRISWLMAARNIDMVCSACRARSMARWWPVTSFIRMMRQRSSLEALSSRGRRRMSKQRRPACVSSQMACSSCRPAARMSSSTACSVSRWCCSASR